ncbi:TonB-dependent receptor [Cytophaga hutchinsonii]|nr:TonB-dependent receptor [Cytophaga hutchinsonii]SFX58578.1 iron complex outermembrane recepter protein [Cytophaga hutchinsonii ATCC 33406]
MNIRIGILMVLWFFFSAGTIVNAQTSGIRGRVKADSVSVEYAYVLLKETPFGTVTDSLGNYRLDGVPAGTYIVQVHCTGYQKTERKIVLLDNIVVLNFNLKEDENTNDIVITGVTRATLISENPVSIVSVSPQQMDQTVESNVVDALVKNAPGVTALKTGPNVSKPFIRGLGYNRVLTLYDGVRQEGQQWGDEHGLEVDAYNIHKAEVIKGPASLMYGSDALAGVVSFMPYIPDQNDSTLHGKFTSEYQTNNNLIGNGLQLTYSTAHWVAAVRGSYRAAKNYRNQYDGRVYNTGFDEKNVSALLGYKNSRGYSHMNITLYDNLQGIPDGSRDSLSRKFTKQVYEGAVDDIANRPVVSDKELNAYKLSPLHQHIQHYRIYNHSFYRLGRSDLDLLLAFQQNIRREYNHPTLPQQAGLFVRLNTINYSLRYNAPAFKNIETSVGVNGMSQNNISKDATDFPIPDYSLFDIGSYLYLKWKQNKTTISGGIRYDTRKLHWNDVYVKSNPDTGFDYISTDTTNAYLQYPAFNKTFSGISASIGLTHKLSKKINLKVNIARGYRAPSITELSSNGLDPGAHIVYLGDRSFKPEFSLQEDIGITGEFKDLSLSASIFNNTIQNYIYLTKLFDANNDPIVDDQGNKTYQYKQALAALYGFEATLNIHPERMKGFLFENAFVLTYGFNRDAIYKGQGVNGEYLPFIPPMKLYSSMSDKIQTRSQLFTSVTPRIELEVTGSQNRYLSLAETETFTKGYALLNIGISTDIAYAKNNTMQLYVQVNNLLNTSYQSNMNRLKYFEYYSQTPNGRTGIYNMGRNIAVKLVVNF